MITILIFLAILSVLVFVHEFGHFWSARKMGMRVDEFGFGFPPRLFGIKRKETLYSINALPLGGFVKIKGEDGSHREEADSFGAKKPWQKILVLSAGVIMNFILAAFLISIGYIAGLPQPLDGVSDGNVRDKKIQIVNVVENLPAAKAGVELGDAVISVNGETIDSVPQLIAKADALIGTQAHFVFLRGKASVEKDIDIVKLESTGKGGIGIGLLETGIVSYPVHVAIYKGFESTVYLTGAVVMGFVNVFKNIFAGRGPGVDVSGPVGIAVMTGQVAQLGWAYIIQFAALLSVNLAVINFLPFPALDGGRVIFVLLEKIRGKAVNQKFEGLVHAIGFSLLMLLIIIVTFKDVFRYFR